VEKDWKYILRNELVKGPVCVGVTSVTGGQIRHALEVSKFVKENSGVPVVWGGVHASLLPGQTLENQYIDVVVKGEGEITFFELVNALKRGKSLKGIRGVWYKKNGKIYNNPDRPFINLNKLPELPYHLIDVERYVRNSAFGRSLDIEISRGCPYKCSFCYNTTMFASVWRGMDDCNIFKKIGYLVKKFNLQYVLIIDDYSFLDKCRIERFMQKKIKKGLNFKWGILGGHFKDFDQLDTPFLKLLEESNCKLVGFGAESGSQKILKLINKNITPDQVIRVNEKLKDWDINIICGFMAGFPTETKEDLQKTIDLAFQLKKSNPKFILSKISSCTPFPGTGFFEMSKKFGFKPPSDLEGWQDINWGLEYINLNLPWLSKKDRELLTYLYFCTTFWDLRYIKHALDISKPILFLSWFYSPIARFRVKHLYFKWMLEIKLIRLLERLTNR